MDSADAGEVLEEIDGAVEDPPAPAAATQYSANESASLSVTSGGRLRKKRKKSSWVRNHFDVQGSSIVCLECTSHNEASASLFALSTATGNLASRLKTKHNIEKGNAPVDSTQTTLSNMVVVQRHNVMRDETIRQATVALSRFIVDAKLPFNIVENQGFRTFVSSLNKHLPTISRRTIVRSIEDEFASTLPRIREVFQNISSHIGITCDGWSSRVLRGYFVVTAHWISDEVDLKHVVLEFVRFPIPHNQWTTKELLLRIFADYRVGKKLQAITTDSGSEMPPAVDHVRRELNLIHGLNVSKDWHLRCACHVVHRAVIDSLHPLRDSISTLRSLLKSLRLSLKSREAFRNVQVRLGFTNLREVPNLDVETRWSSTFTMITSCYRLRTVFEAMYNIESLVDSLPGSALSTETWNNLNAIASFLKPAADVVEISSSSSNVTASIQARVFHKLRKHCEDTCTDSNAIEFVRKAADLLKKKLEKHEFHFTRPFIQMSSALDPMFANKTDVSQHIKHRMITKLQMEYGISPDDVDVQEKPESAKGFELLASDNSDEDNNSLNTEVEEYFSATRRPDKTCTNVVDWWKREGRHRYPTIFRLARDHLMAMGSSVPSESSFSDSGDIVSTDRTRLSDSHVRMLVLLRSWNRFLGVL